MLTSMHLFRHKSITSKKIGNTEGWSSSVFPRLCLFYRLLQLLLEKAQYRNLFWSQPMKSLLDGILIVLVQCFEQRTIEVGIYHFWMHITFATDGRSVAQVLCRYFDRPHHVLFRLCLRFILPQVLQRAGGNHCSGPGTKILCRKILPGNLPQILVHIV